MALRALLSTQTRNQVFRLVCKPQRAGFVGITRAVQEGSHPDYGKQTTELNSDQKGDAHSFIQGLVDSSAENKRPLLFMKGTPEEPRCGFSFQVVRVLHAEGVDFDAVDVLADAEIREGVKSFSDWPTIPQLYVEKEFVGGCDIVTSMHQDGELATLFKEANVSVGSSE